MSLFKNSKIKDLFKSKEEKMRERKMLVRKSMKELNKRIKNLEDQEEKYIKAAQIAIKEELPDQVRLAKQALKLTIAERKRTYKMLLNAEIISQMKDTAAMTKDFLQAVHVISKDIAGSASADMSKISGELKLAMDKVSEQSEELENMLEDTNDDFDDISVESSLVSDDEIDKRIYGGAAKESKDSDIDAELEKLKSQL